MADLANAAAAVSAGYTKTQTDRGASASSRELRYFTTFSKTMRGITEGSGRGSFPTPTMMVAFGESGVDADTADTQALAALNTQRQDRFVKSGGGTIDLT